MHSELARNPRGAIPVGPWASGLCVWALRPNTSHLASAFFLSSLNGFGCVYKGCLSLLALRPPAVSFVRAGLTLFYRQPLGGSPLREGALGSQLAQSHFRLNLNPEGVSACGTRPTLNQYP